MATLYVQEQGSRLGVRQERLIVKRGEELLLDVPVIKVDRVVIMGRGVQVSTAALVFLAQRGIPLVFTSRMGRGYPVSVQGWTLRNGERLLAQVDLVRNPARALPVVQAIVQGKLANQTALLRAWGPIWGVAAGPALGVMERAYQATATARDADQARGYEGAGAAAYWGVWRTVFAAGWGFDGRKYRPAPDPLNALLSFGYTILLNEVLAAVQISGMDLSLGFFHVVEAGRPSLALDLEEEFRALLVDDLVLRLLQERLITTADFQPAPEQPGAIHLTDAARVRFIQAYEARLDTKVPYPYLPQPATETWHRCVLLQVQQMARVIEGRQAGYQALPWPG